MIQSEAKLLGALLSDGRVKLYDISTLGSVAEVRASGAGSGSDSGKLESPQSLLRDAAFMPSDPSKLWVAAADGEITCWDVRRGVPLRQFSRPQGPMGRKADKEGLYSGPFSLAVNHGGDVLAAGVANEIHLWDLRSPSEKPLGVYSASHSPAPPAFGTVRCLAWHPSVPHTLVSGGDDGIVNVFSTAIRGEDDALVSVINVGSAVASLGFFGPSGAFLWVITEFDAFSLWNIGSAQRIAEFPALRMQFLEAGLPVSYLLGCHYDVSSGGLSLLAGGHDGTLHLFDVTPTAVSLRANGQSFAAAAAGGSNSSSSSSSGSAHENTIRAATWARVSGVANGAGDTSAPDGLALFTGDEDGRLCQWLNASAQAALSSVAANSVSWEGEWDYARPPGYKQPHAASVSSAAPSATVATEVNGIAMRLPPAGSEQKCDADSFGSRAADPISDADDSAPLGAEAATLMGVAELAGSTGPVALPAAALEGGDDDDHDMLDDAAGGVGGKRKSNDDSSDRALGGKKQRV